MITLQQIKAARALLGWTQEKLAKAASVSLPSINNLERGLYSPRQETFQLIVTALERAGIEFTAQNGLRLRQEEHEIINFTGPDFIRDLDSDILSVLQGPEDEIAGVSCDEKKWMEYGAVTNPAYIEAREKKGWKERLIIPDKASFITSPSSSYRVLPAKYLGQGTFEIYGNRLALVDWGGMRVTLIKNAVIAETFLKNFNRLWEVAVPLSAKQVRGMERLAVPRPAKR